MSRSKKSRSLKRNHAGVKTGTKERTKLERKQSKAKSKLANPRAVTRQRSVYQQFLDSNNLVEGQHAAAKAPESPAIKPIYKDIQSKVSSFKHKPKPSIQKKIETPIATEDQKDDLWDQLETPQNNDIF